MKCFFRLLLLITCLILVPHAKAGDLIVSRAVLEDVGGTLTIADVASREFQPLGPSLFKGITDSVHWIRLRVRAPANGNEVVLFIRQPFLNEIRLFEAEAGDSPGWKTRVTGNHYPFSERERGRHSLGFVVNVATPEATFYLRLKTKSTSQLTVLALEPSEAERLDDHFDLLEVLFVTAMLLLLLWAIQSYLLDRLRVVGLFAIHQAVYTLFGIAITGYLAPWLPMDYPQLVELSSAIPYCGVAFTTLLFCRELFKPYEPPPILMRGLNLLLLLFPLQLVAMALGYIPQAVIVNLALIRVSWWYFVFMTFFLRKEQSPNRRWLQVFFFTITLVFTVFWFSSSSLNDTGNSLFGRQVLIANGLIIGGLFAMILNARSRRLLQEVQQSSMNLLLAQKTLEIERTLKKKAEEQAHTDYLTGLCNRRHFFELAERELARSTRYQRPFAVMMIDIDHFKTINDTWGHSVGDLVLQKVSQLIRDTLRSVDIFGRIGGEEFAAVIVETDGSNAVEVAQRLCLMVADARISPREGVCVQVTISIGVTAMNGKNLSFENLMGEADQVLYRAKQAGRNRAMASEYCAA
ncbi:diguanylate cyclase [Propionivibrio limicola]|uniref:diguanylate cyclase n=1 Tax=Propionivibrio limicola TaxID=167645 RepID=UPI001292AE86|nr:diguanylate cyclase [Propionivibrio limicola]